MNKKVSLIDIKPEYEVVKNISSFYYDFDCEVFDTESDKIIRLGCFWYCDTLSGIAASVLEVLDCDFSVYSLDDTFSINGIELGEVCPEIILNEDYLNSEIAKVMYSLKPIVLYDLCTTTVECTNGKYYRCRLTNVNIMPYLKNGFSTEVTDVDTRDLEDYVGYIITADIIVDNIENLKM